MLTSRTPIVRRGLAAGSSAPLPARRSALRRLRKSGQVVGLAVMLFFGVLALRPLVSQNLGIIEPGRALRSSQPTSGLEAMIRDHGIASILNLRGGDPGDSWYDHEVRTAREAGVAFYDLPLSAVRRPTRRELLLLIDVLAAAPPPLLIHCRAGADRTGMATAVYKLIVLGEPPEEAIESFTVFHGHFPVLGPQHLHEPIDEYAAWLKAGGLPHEPARFRRWVLENYEAPDPHVEPSRRIVAGPRHPV